MADSNRKHTAAERVWRAMPDGARKELAAGLPPADLQSLLIDVAAARASYVGPADLVARWRRDRFVQPSRCDPRRVSAIEVGLWQLLPNMFVGVELSPVAPLGSCTAVAPMSQNRIVTTMRLSEVMSDSGNALAIEAAVRRLDQPPDGQVHRRHPPATSRAGIRARRGRTLPAFHARLERARHRLSPHRGRPIRSASRILDERAGDDASSSPAADRGHCIRPPRRRCKAR